jgi:hypothetical protein
MREVAIHILREQSIPIKGAELKRQIEEKTGFKIANMTTFKKSVAKSDEHMKKPNRGYYKYHVK